MIAATDIERARAARIEDEIDRRGISNLKRQGGELVGPCRMCGGNDRFAIHIKKQLWNCRGYGGGDVIKLVQHLDGCEFRDAITTLVGNGPRKPSPAKPEESDRYKDEQRNLDRAEAIWRETSPLGPEAITYFTNRCIDINQVPEHGGLRFHPHCHWPGNITKPCITGRFTTALGNEQRGILRRPITGEKAIALGPMGGCVIRLWPDEAVEQGLVIGEGVETVLSMATRAVHRGTLLQPAWAVCVANNLKRFPILPGIEALTVLVDNDLPDEHDRRAGQDAAAECAARWSAAGREVIRLTPKALGADFNDVVLRHGA
jgi:phage/plasmid primase-like uncharacterized protein